MGNLNFDAKAFEQTANQGEKETSFQFFESSAKVKAAIKTKALGSNKIYPFDLLPVGQSFRIQITEDLKESALRVLCSETGKKLNKKFKCLKYKKEGFFEVARVA
jgi:hypothetical protein